MTRVSIKHIAELLKVSPSTVSFVLNGKEKEMSISQELASKVRQAAKELNYMPNMAARSLRTRKTKTIGLIVADISNPFFSKLARFVENIATKNKYQVIFGSSDESNLKFQNLCNLFLGKSVDGMIVVPPLGGYEALSKLLENKMPLVVIDRETENTPINTVMMDNSKAAHILTTQLIKNGCKKIGLIGHNKNFRNVVARLGGYKKALEDNNLEFYSELVQFVDLDNFEENIEKALDVLLKNKIDSILFATSKSGRKSLFVLKKRSYLKKLKYASIDLFEECELSDITLFSIEQPLDIMCEKALTILFKQIDDPKYQTIETIILHPPLIKKLD